MTDYTHEEISHAFRMLNEDFTVHQSKIVADCVKECERILELNQRSFRDQQKEILTHYLEGLRQTRPAANLVTLKGGRDA